MTAKPATLTVCFENVQTETGVDFAKLWYLHPADPFLASRILGRTTDMSRDEALRMATRILGADVPVRCTFEALRVPTPAEQQYMRAGRDFDREPTPEWINGLYSRKAVVQ